MPEGHFGPLPGQTRVGQEPVQLDEQYLKRWLASQLIEGIQLGDLISANWDGSLPLNLSSEDTSATTGFALDDSQGSGQFMGSVWVGGDVFITQDDGSLKVGPTNDQIIITSETDKYLLVGSSTFANSVIEFDVNWSVAGINENAVIATYDGSSTGDPYVFMAGPHKGTSIQDAARVSLGIDESTDATLGGLRADEVTLGNNTSGGFVVVASETLEIQDGSASSPGLNFRSDQDTGVYRVGTNRIGWSAGGSVLMSLGASEGFRASTIDDNTTSSSANVNINSSSNQLQRSTSSLKYKPDWKWARGIADYTLPTPITWTDEEGQERLGFGAEHVHEAVPEAYEHEIYDLRTLVAILSEKVKRLEAARGLAG